MDKFVKQRKIGEGSFGKALLVKKKSDGKLYVIKEINISKMSPKERQESRKEVKVLAHLKHPNIVSYIESFEEIGNLYIVMDYCEGGDLYKKINQARGVYFPEKQVMDWFVQLCLALKHVHDRKILHRDIKSQNIFLTKHNTIKLGDFGIARVLNSTVELARTCIGTPYYLSPEICENRPYNNKSDIWSVGCVLYEMLTLKHAFEAGNMKNLVLKIIRGSYPPVPVHYTPDVRLLVAKLFKRNPHDRPSINSILKQPFVQKRIEKFLSEDVMEDEFSHTVLHRKPLGQRNVARPPVNKPPNKPPSPVFAKPAPVKQAAAPGRYNPASKYGVPVAKKPVKKSGSKEGNKKGPKPGEVEKARSADKKKEVDPRERRRNQEMDYNEKMKKMQQDRWARQQQDKINKARERPAWRASMEIISPEKKAGQEKPRPSSADDSNENKRPNHLPVKPGNGNGFQEKENKPVVAAKPAWVAPKQDAWQPPAGAAVPAAKPQRPVSAYEHGKHAQVNRALGGAAAERARQVEEYWQRKREAAANKARAQLGLGMGRPSAAPSAAAAAAPPQQLPVRNNALPSHLGGMGKNNQEEEYLQRLEAIRRQNFAERKAIQQRMAGVKDPSAQKMDKGDPYGDPRVDPAARKKKMEALKAQAEERAKVLREQLEAKRKAVFDRIDKEADARVKDVKERAVKADERPLPVLDKKKGFPAIPPGPQMGLETALNNIGVSKPLAKSSSEGDLIEKLKEEDAGPRKQWADVPFQPKVMPLEETASAMDATTTMDLVEKPAMFIPFNQQGRKQWGQPQKTKLMSELGNAALQTETLALMGDRIDSPPHEAPMGVTVTIKDQPPKDAANTPPKVPIGVTMTVGESKPSPNLGVTVTKSPKAPEVIEVTKSNIGAILEEDSPEESEPEEKPAASPQALPDPKKSMLGSLESTGESDAVTNTVVSQMKSVFEGSEKSSEGGKDGVQESIEVIPDEKPSVPPQPEEKPPKPVAAWGAVVTSTPTKLSPRAKSPVSPGLKSPRSPKSLNDSRKAYDQFVGDLSKGKDSPESPVKQPEPAKSEPLFQKVEQDLGEKDIKVEEDIQVQDEESFHSATSGSLEGTMRILDISNGKYDISTRHLRTCSEPDLRLLFKTETSFHTPGEFVPAQDDDEEEEELEEEEKEDEEEEDLEDVEDEEIIDDVEDEELDIPEEDSDEDEDDEESRDYESMLESMRGVLNKPAVSPMPCKTLDWDHSVDKGSPGFDEDEEEDKISTASSMSNLNEDWDSDEGEEDVEDPDLIPSETWGTKKLEKEKKRQEEDASVYARIEESRMKLEEALGFETFIKVYKCVQAMQESDDDNKNVTLADDSEILDILGPENEHLYPKILYLVMADAAYCEDNE